MVKKKKKTEKQNKGRGGWRSDAKLVTGVSIDIYTWVRRNAIGGKMLPSFAPKGVGGEFVGGGGWGAHLGRARSLYLS